MKQLRSRYLGMDLRSPLVASPSPRTGHLDDLLVLDGCPHWWPWSRAAEVAAALTELWSRG